MESKIGQVGKSAVRIGTSSLLSIILLLTLYYYLIVHLPHTYRFLGEQLESIHVSRQRAQAAHDLIDYYNQFSKDDTQRLDALRKDGGKAGRRQVAIILRRLLTVAKEVDLPDAEQVSARAILML